MRLIVTPAAFANASARERASPTASASALLLRGLTVFQVEADVAHRRRARRHRRVDYFADLLDRVDTHFNRVARDIAAQRLLAVVVVELRLQIERDRAHGVARNAGRLQPLLHGGHRLGVLLLRGFRQFRARFRGDRHICAIGRGRDEALSVRHDYFCGPGASRGRGLRAGGRLQTGRGEQQGAGQRGQRQLQLLQGIPLFVSGRLALPGYVSVPRTARWHRAGTRARVRR